MKIRVFFVLASVLGLLFLPGTATASPQFAPIDTSFTYQGRLTDGGLPADGPYDFEFSLWDAATGGTQVGLTLPIDDLVVTDGLFTAVLSFGDYFDGTALFLQIAVRPGAEIGAYTVLDPRQYLSATPYALYSAVAPWAGLTGVPSGFADGVDDGATYTAGSGLALIASQFSVTGAPWSGLTGVPSGFADGVDDGATYTAGNGLTLAGGQFAVDFAGSGVASSAARSDHAHWGASWTGTGTGLTLSGGTTGVSASGGDFGLYGTSVDYGVYGYSTDAAGAGVFGENYAGTGVRGNGGDYGVFGSSSANTGVHGESTNGTGVYGSGFDYGVQGLSSDDTGVHGVGPDFGVHGDSTTGVGVWGSGDIGVDGSGATTGVQGSGTAYGVTGSASGALSTGVDGNGSLYGVNGSSTNTGVHGDGYNTGVLGTSALTGVYGTGDIHGVQGESTTGTGVRGNGGTYGVYGSSDTTGVYGDGTTNGVYGVSTTGTGVRGGGDTGVSGDGVTTGVQGNGGNFGVHGVGDTGVSGTSTTGTGVHGVSTNGTGMHAVGGTYGVRGYGDVAGLYGSSAAPGGIGVYGSGPSYAGYFDGNVHITGNSSVDGTKSAVVETEDYGTRALYSIESPESWFEDFGTGQLTNGAAVITIEPIFAQTVNLEDDYHVFVTPLGDCALYVDTKAPASFAVHAMGGQTCSTAFDYRIVAKRLGYEELRLAEVEINAPALVDPQ